MVASTALDHATDTVLDLTLPTPYSDLRQFLAHVRLSAFEANFRSLGAAEVDDLLRIVYRNFDEVGMTRHQRVQMVRQLVARRDSIEDVEAGVTFGDSQFSRVTFADYCEFLQTATNATEVVITKRPMGFGLVYEQGDMVVRASSNQAIQKGWVLKWIGNVDISKGGLEEDEILNLLHAMHCPFSLLFQPSALDQYYQTQAPQKQLIDFVPSLAPVRLSDLNATLRHVNGDHQYIDLLKMALADGWLDPIEATLLEGARAKHGITLQRHYELLATLTGLPSNASGHNVQDHQLGLQAYNALLQVALYDGWLSWGEDLRLEEARRKYGVTWAEHYTLMAQVVGSGSAHIDSVNPREISTEPMPWVRHSYIDAKDIKLAAAHTNNHHLAPTVVGDQAYYRHHYQQQQQAYTKAGSQQGVFHDLAQMRDYLEAHEQLYGEAMRTSERCTSGCVVAVAMSLIFCAGLLATVCEVLKPKQRYVNVTAVGASANFLAFIILGCYQCLNCGGRAKAFCIAQVQFRSLVSECDFVQGLMSKQQRSLDAMDPSQPYVQDFIRKLVMEADCIKADLEKFAVPEHVLRMYRHAITVNPADPYSSLQTRAS
jgi:hypothetical protein